jgi:hypothetical protein
VIRKSRAEALYHRGEYAHGMTDPEITGLLRQIQGYGDEELHRSAREAMGEYCAEALARRNAAQVELLRARLKTRLQEPDASPGRSDPS